MQQSNECLILIVEDAELNVRILAKVLGRDYEVAVARNGASAMRILSETRPALVLLDVMLPDLDGFEILRTVKDDPATSSIPVILLTGLSDQESRARGFQLGAVDFITKPYEFDEVRARVATHLSRPLVGNERVPPV